jgi:Asp-tRNA(Asn)/Glu-tRNA(Gln) amidotransferase A subunit family amidase
VEATQGQLKRIEQLDGSLKSYATVMADHALADAQAADKAIGEGQIKGPLHGVPIAVKDLCWTASTKTAAGMTIHANNIPTEDGTVVRKLREAGAVILGKLQLTEGAYADHHPHITPPVNPWGEGQWPGASSSGSGVATAAGLCYGSLGSDTGGSIRIPAALCGLVGFKSTAQSAGLSVSELTAEKNVETAMVTANCLKNCPVIPVIKMHGTNTHIRTNEIAMIGPETSSIALIAAWRGSMPCSR